MTTLICFALKEEVRRFGKSHGPKRQRAGALLDASRGSQVSL
jgi:hypothetical protein